MPAATAAPENEPDMLVLCDRPERSARRCHRTVYRLTQLLQPANADDAPTGARRVLSGSAGRGPCGRLLRVSVVG